MTTYNFPSDLGWAPGGGPSYFSDSSLSIGTKFTLTTPASVVGVRVFSISVDAPYTVDVQLWAAGTKVAEVTGAVLVPDWNTVNFTTPYSATTGVEYVVSVWHASGTPTYYSARSLSFSADGTTPTVVTVGPATSNDAVNGRFGTTSAIPATSFNSAWYGVDAILETGGTAAPRAVASAIARAPVVSVISAGSVTAVRATGTAAAPAPVPSGTGATVVTAVRAQATATTPIPAVDVVVTLTGGGAAAGTAVARPPTVSSSSVGSVAGVRATATADAVAPAVSAAVLGTVTGVRATVAATAPAPTVTGTSVGAVNAVRATATATSNPPGVILAETLPSNVQVGRITGRFAEAKVLVGDADGVANLYPITTETITFTSTAPVLLDTAATPAPVVIIPKPIVCTLDSNGYLVDSAGHQYVDLIATNDPDLTPATRKWRVTFSAGLAAATGVTFFDIVVLSGATKDLTADIPT